MRRRGTRSAAVVIALAGAARAEPAATATARELAVAGIDAIEAGDCATGLPLVERAERLYHASVHLQYLARCHLKAGRLVTASEMFRRIVREGAPEGATPAVYAAIDEATRQLPNLLPRLARTTLSTPEQYDAVEAVLDGNPLPADLLNAPHVLDPGPHVLSVRAPGREPWSRQWTLPEGGSAAFVIELVPTKAPHPRPPATPGATGSDEAPPAKPSGSAMTTVGWIAAGAGAATLIAGTATLLTRNNRRENLLDKCPNGTCDTLTAAQLEKEKAPIEDLTLAANVLFVAGAATLGTGVVLILVGSSDGGATGAAAGSFPVSGASIGLSGVF